MAVRPIGTHVPGRRRRSPAGTDSGCRESSGAVETRLHGGVSSQGRVRSDLEVLRRLASEVAEIAALPVQQETIALWRAHNSLRPVRPMALVDEIPWHEMDLDGSLALQTEDEAARSFERSLRQTLYRWRHLRADMVVEPVIDAPWPSAAAGSG